MAYFDNASTTYPKPYCVYDFMDSFYRSSGANAGRGNYKLAQSAGALIGDTRKKIQELLHCQAKQVVFEPTATIALNIIIQGIIEKGAVNIYISPFEHNAVTRTLHHFEEQEKIKITQLTVSKGMVYDLEKIRYQFDTVKPDFVIVSHASNVFGLIAPVEDIFALAKKYEAITLVDMAQTAGLVDLNVGLKEYIQRRGRVLRKAANKPFAEIYDFVTLPRPLDSVSGLTIEQANRDKTLVKNELARIKEFGRLALNSMLANNLIWDIQEAYHLNETDLEKEGEDFE